MLNPVRVAVILLLAVFFPCTLYASQQAAPVTGYAREARQTIEIGVDGIMKEMKSCEQLQESVEGLVESWNDWARSRLFILSDDRDIDVYGNLYSLQVMCRTLFLACEDWNRAVPGKLSESVLEKARWLEAQSRLLADPVSEILRRQSYSDDLRLRVDIMQREFAYVDTYYNSRPFHVEKF